MKKKIEKKGLIRTIEKKAKLKKMNRWMNIT